MNPIKLELQTCELTIDFLRQDNDKTTYVVVAKVGVEEEVSKLHFLYHDTLYRQFHTNQSRTIMALVEELKGTLTTAALCCKLMRTETRVKATREVNLACNETAFMGQAYDVLKNVVNYKAA